MGSDFPGFSRIPSSAEAALNNYEGVEGGENIASGFGVHLARHDEASHRIVRNNSGLSEAVIGGVSHGIFDGHGNQHRGTAIVNQAIHGLMREDANYGGHGDKTVEFFGKHSDYDVFQNNQGDVVVQNRSKDERRILRNIEGLQFSNGTVSISQALNRGHYNESGW